MKQLRAIWPLALVIVLTVSSGVVSGVWSYRWGAPPRAQLSAAKLAELPDEYGDWQLQSEVPIGKDVLEILQCAGNLHRVYRNRETGQLINVVLLLGPAGPIAAHTPEICYSSRDYEQLGAPRRHHIALGERAKARAAESAPSSTVGNGLRSSTVGNGLRAVPQQAENGPELHGDEPATNPKSKIQNPKSEPTLWRMAFRSRGLDGQTLNVGYAWNAGQGWVAADWPRVVFAGQSMLYKLQFSTNVGPGSVDESDDRSDEFLKAFLPACDAILF